MNKSKLIYSVILSLCCFSVVQVFGSALSSSDSTSISSQNLHELQSLLQRFASTSGSEPYVSLQRFQDLEKRMTEMENVHEELMKLKQGLEAEKQNNEFTRNLFNLCSESEASFRANAKGAPGEKGDRGNPGQDGKKGDKGERGPAGPQGPKGNSGQKGDSGEKGESGKIGNPGAKGQTGLTGEKGDIGQKGEIGESGQDGKSGQKGEMGERGPAGPQGAKGDFGQDGKPGEKGEIGENGKDGQKGESGPQGQKGVSGQNGLAGEKGGVGPKGDQGLTGPKGGRGEKGEQGPPGPKGNQGLSAFQSISSCSDAMEILPSPLSKKQKIYPHGNGTSLEVLCDFETNGGEWTIIQKRSSGPQQEFNRTWTEYASGFGSLDGNFWLGLENIYALTKNGDQELRIQLEDFEGEKRWAKYSNFSISNASDFYRLSLSGYSQDSTLTDSMTNSTIAVNHGMRFSTKDKDNDLRSDENCAVKWFGGGGWWFNACGVSGLNGFYFDKGETVPEAKGIYWRSWKGFYYSLAKSEMKIRARK